jgi:hypothetical protein
MPGTPNSYYTYLGYGQEPSQRQIEYLELREKCDALAETLSGKLKTKGYRITHMPDWVGHAIESNPLGISFSDLQDPSLREVLLKRVLRDLNLRADVVEHTYSSVAKVTRSNCTIFIYADIDEGVSLNVLPRKGMR